jgi:hypothetical protein
MQLKTDADLIVVDMVAHRCLPEAAGSRDISRLASGV